MRGNRQSLAAKKANRAGFSLTEMMIVMVIIGIVTGLSLAAGAAFLKKAKVDATQSLINQLNAALQERLEGFYSDSRKGITATVAMKALAGNAAAPDGSVIGKRAKIIAVLDAMRGEFPQQFMDFMRQTDLPQGFGDPNSARPMRAAIYQAYLSRSYVAPAATKTPQVTTAAPYAPAIQYGLPAGHVTATESSECLYLMLSIPSPNSSFSADQIPQRFIADTDRDGLNEFVDSWGNPLRFYRWPTDLIAYLIDGTEQLPKTMLKSANPMDYGVAVLSNNLDPDGMLTEAAWFGGALRQNTFERGVVGPPPQGGYCRLHWPYAVPAANGIPIDPTTAPVPAISRAYPIIPMIISAGPDEKFGLNGEVGGFVAPAVATAAFTDFVAGRVDPALLKNVKDNLISVSTEKGNVR